VVKRITIAIYVMLAITELLRSASILSPAHHFDHWWLAGLFMWLSIILWKPINN